MTLAAVALFFTGLPLELVALGAAAVVLLDRIKPEKVYRQVDWSLLVMFTGLFIVVHAFQVHVVAGWGIEGWTWLLNRPTDLLSLVSAALSNLVSNVPAVLLLEPVAQAVPDGHARDGLAGAGDVEHLRRQSHRARLGGQPDRRGERTPRGGDDLVLGVLQGRHPADDPHARAGDRLAAVRPLLDGAVEAFSPAWPDKRPFADLLFQCLVLDHFQRRVVLPAAPGDQRRGRWTWPKRSQLCRNTS